MFNYAVERQCEEAGRVINITCKQRGTRSPPLLWDKYFFLQNSLEFHISAVTVVHLYLFKCLIYDPF